MFGVQDHKITDQKNQDVKDCILINVIFALATPIVNFYIIIYKQHEIIKDGKFISSITKEL
jgi:hypothetical protein